MKHRWLALTTALISVSANVAAVEDHAAAPMMAPHNAPVVVTTDEEQAEPQRTEPAGAIIERFQAQGNGPQRMAIFWNRDFDDQVSDWVSLHRHVIASGGRVEGTIPEGDVAVSGSGSTALQSEWRRAPEQAAEPAFELRSGLVSQLTEAGVQVIDRAASMRLSDNALEAGDFSRLSPDQRRLETRALGEHADLLLLLNRVHGERFEIEVLDLKTGAIRALLVSNGLPPEDPSASQWQATDHGFRKLETAHTLDEVGQELALQILAKLSS